MSTGRIGYGKELNYPGYLGHCTVGRVSYLGRLKQGNYYAHVLYTIPNPNYTLPKPYPFIIAYPIHHANLGIQIGRVLPCASINTTLPWIPTYPCPSIVIPYPSTYPTLPTVGKIHLSIYLTYPIHVTSSYIPVPTSQLPFVTYPNLYFSLPYTIARAKLDIRPKRPTRLIRNRPRTETTQAETTQAETTQGRNDSDQNDPRMQLRL